MDCTRPLPDRPPSNGFLAVLLAGILGLCAFTAAAQTVETPPEAARSREAIVLDIEGAIGPATVEYLRRSLAEATRREAGLVILRMDTPGGLDSAMREIIRDIIASPIAIATYVSPSGARAASAGTYILYASHIAAMAPGTNLGAATPVQLGGGRQPLDRDKEDAGQDKQPSAPADAMTAKAVNDAVAFIRGLAELRGRNADWAEEAVRQAASLPARQALARSVVDIVANDLSDLLAQADGRTVRIGSTEHRLDTAGLRPVVIEPDWRTRLLATITHPSIAYVLLLIGIYGIVFEFLSPGAIVPGVIGAICLLIAAFALNLLPVNYAGVGLILLGVALMTAEAFLPSFGILGIGGIIAFVLGSLLVFDRDVPGFALSWPIVMAAATVSAGTLIIAATAVVRAHRRRVATGDTGLIGMTGEVLAWSDGHGQVHVQGERWAARADVVLAPRQRVRVVARERLTLVVEPAAETAPENRGR